MQPGTGGLLGPWAYGCPAVPVRVTAPASPRGRRVEGGDPGKGGKGGNGAGVAAAGTLSSGSLSRPRTVAPRGFGPEANVRFPSRTDREGRGISGILWNSSVPPSPSLLASSLERGPHCRLRPCNPASFSRCSVSGAAAGGAPHCRLRIPRRSSAPHCCLHPPAENCWLQPPAENCWLHPPAEHCWLHPPAEHCWLHPPAEHCWLHPPSEHRAAGSIARHGPSRRPTGFRRGPSRTPCSVSALTQQQLPGRARARIGPDQRLPQAGSNAPWPGLRRRGARSFVAPRPESLGRFDGGRSPELTPACR